MQAEELYRQKALQNPSVFFTDFLTGPSGGDWKIIMELHRWAK